MVRTGPLGTGEQAALRQELRREPVILELPRIADTRGTLTFLESGRHLPFPIRRAYWIYDVPGGEVRGAHAYRHNEEFIVAVSGSFAVALDDGRAERVFRMDRAYRGLYVPPGLWRQMRNFATNSVALVLASLPYDADDYVRDHAEFLSMARDHA